MDADFVILLLSVSYAVGIVWSSVPKLTGSPQMKGPAQWDLKESWASNLTAVGAIVTTVMAVKPIQEAAKLDVKLFVLSLFFAALSVTTPFVYNALATEPRNRTTNGQVKEVEASLHWFLIASVMTLWAVIGQLLTLGVVLYLTREKAGTLSRFRTAATGRVRYDRSLRLPIYPRHH
jgi:hypothetical protein